MPAIKHDDMLLRLVKDLNEVRSVLRRVVANLPLFDIDNENTPAQLTVSQNNYVPGNYDVLRISSNRIVSITGIRNGVRGRKLRIFNTGSYSILIPSLSSSSSSVNRFQLQGGRNPVYLTSIEPSTNLQFYYDATIEKWLTVSSPPAYDVGEDWTARTAPVYTKSVCYSPDLNIFVAVGNNRCMTSSDGLTWTESTMPLGNWVSIIWESSISKFVAVSSNTSRVAVSSNGSTWTNNYFPSEIDTWTSRTSDPTTATWASVCWSPELGIFCAVSLTGVVMTSPDGITWTARTAAEANQWNGVCWSPELNLFCAVASNGTNRVMTSPDGTTWTARTADSNSDQWRSIAWSPSLTLFCAVGEGISDTPKIMTSPDGTTWTARTSSNSSRLTSITWSPTLGIFCVVSNYTALSNQVITSANGTSWSNRTAAEANQWNGVCWSPELNLFCAVAASGTNRAMTSPDGTTWTARTMDGNSWKGIAWSPALGLFCAISSSGTSRVATSPDGITWTARTAASALAWTCICWSPELGVFCAAAAEASSINVMTSGYKILALNSVSSNGTTLVSVGVNLCITSTDASAWTERTIQSATWKNVIYVSSLSIFLSVGSSTKCSTSPDGITWTARTIPTGDWNCVAFSPELGLFCAISSATNYVATSPDGTTWTVRTADAEVWTGIVWCSEISVFIAVGTDISMASSDGINWSVSTVSISGNWEAIAWANELTRAIAVASGGTNKVISLP